MNIGNTHVKLKTIGLLLTGAVRFICICAKSWSEDHCCKSKKF